MYSTLSEAEKRSYHQEKRRLSSGFSLPFRGSSSRDQISLHSSVLEVPRKKGRPPLDPANGRMDSESLKERKRQLGKESYKKVKISQVRAAAVMKRKDRVSQAGDGDSSDQESEEVGDSCEEESEVEAEGPNRRQYHSRTVARKKKEFFTTLPTSYIFQLKVLKKLVGDFGIGKLSVGKDKNPNEDASKSTLYRYISQDQELLDQL